MINDGCAERARLCFSRQVPPILDTGRLIACQQTFGSPASSSVPGPRIPSRRMRASISGHGAPWALRPPVTRELPLSVSQMVVALRRPGNHATPQCPRFSLHHTNGRLNIERSERKLLTDRKKQRCEQSSLRPFRPCSFASPGFPRFALVARFVKQALETRLYSLFQYVFVAYIEVMPREDNYLC
jgi:hypothetical protein